MLGVDLKFKLREVLASYKWHMTYRLIDGVHTFTVVSKPFGGVFRYKWKDHVFYVDDDTFPVLLDVLKENNTHENTGQAKDPRFVIAERQKFLDEIACKALEKRRILISVPCTKDNLSKLEKGEPVEAKWEDCALLYPEEIENYIEGLLCERH